MAWRAALKRCFLRGLRASLRLLFPQNSGKKKAHKHKLFGPVALGTPRECPGDKPVPGTNPGFLLSLHWKPSLSLGQTQFVPGTFRGRRAAERVYVLKVYVPFSFPKNGRKETDEDMKHRQLRWHVCRVNLGTKTFWGR